MLPGKKAAPDSGADTTRLEAFSDGVFAVAITLLVLNLTVPQPDALRSGATLLTLLDKQWPAYLAYVLSFLTILIYWVNHHNVFKCIKHVDRTFLLLNGLLLLAITTIPFGTALLAAYIERSDQKIAELVYTGILLVTAVIFNRAWAYATHDMHLVGKEVDARFVQAITRQFSFGPPLYLIAFLVAFVSAQASLAICIVLGGFFAMPSSLDRYTSPD